MTSGFCGEASSRVALIDKTSLCSRPQQKKSEKSERKKTHKKTGKYEKRQKKVTGWKGSKKKGDDCKQRTGCGVGHKHEEQSDTPDLRETWRVGRQPGFLQI